jgi:prepilin-type N-terminal cleavage/methylation domain-containing protein
MTVNRAKRAFSLIELVIVVVIIGIIGAIAIPRMSRGAEGAADSALVSNLATLRSAIDLFATEHGGKFPTLAQMPTALISYSNETATTIQAAKDGPNGIIYGPYLRAVPSLPVGAQRGDTGFGDAASGYTAAGNIGWLYNASTGELKANCDATEQDARGKLYTAY